MAALFHAHFFESRAPLLRAPLVSTSPLAVRRPIDLREIAAWLYATAVDALLFAWAFIVVAFAFLVMAGFFL